MAKEHIYKAEGNFQNVESKGPLNNNAEDEYSP